MSIMETVVKVATTQADLKKKVVYFSISSRLFIILLSFISNVVFPDHNAGVYMFPKPHYNETTIDRVVDKLFGGLNRWDAQYFLHISHYGYTYENTLAFFPLFPYLTRITAQCLEFLFGSLMNTLSAVLLSAVIINFMFFVGAAAKLFDLSCIILQDDSVSYIATLFFCMNPASIFFTAPYSESCYSFFIFSGMLFYIKYDNNLLSSLAFSVSACVRSNGLINIGFIAHKCIKESWHIIKRNMNFYFVYCTVRSTLIKLTVYFIVLFAPYTIFQFYLYFIFCLNKVSITHFLKQYGLLHGFVMPDNASSPWCNYYIPLSYSYIQSYYWHVGFLKYYQFKQIPNFLLALPVIFLILGNSYLFFIDNKKSLYSLGFNNTDFVTFCDRKIRSECFVFVFHAAFLTIFCVFFVHIQVTTRIIASSCPVLYWFVALRYNSAPVTIREPIQSRLRTTRNGKSYCFIESQANLNSFWKTAVICENPGDLHSNLFRLYFCSYAIIGTVLFSNYYPWT